MAVKELKKQASKVKAPENNLAKTIGLTEEIRAEAQKIYEIRQAKHLEGDENTDWLKAEAKINKQRTLI